MARQPGKWDGRQWVCSDQPPNKKKFKMHYCCPGGYRTVDPRTIQGVGSSMKITAAYLNCSAPSSMMSCGPKPEGEVKCCPEIHKWIPKSQEECPMPEGRSGLDIDFLRRLRLQGKAAPETSRKLLMIGIPMGLAAIALIFLIARS